LTLLRSRRSGERLGRPELAEACGCDVRTIHRDLELLQGQANVPLEYDRKERTYRLPERGWTFPLREIRPEDALALAFARRLLTTPGQPAVALTTAALDGLMEGFTPALRRLFTDAAAEVQTAGLPRDYADAPVADLMNAALERRTVEIDYESRSGGGRSLRNVDPYAVEARDGIYWELHGWCHKNRAIRTFALDRIHAVRALEETFEIRNDAWERFRSSKGVFGGWRGGAAVEVAVRFSPEAAPYALDRRWPESLSIRRREDGSALLTGTAQGEEGILPEILRWRRHAEVLGGPELRARMAEEIRAMAATYALDLEKTRKILRTDF
jgi:predicted DNA-binding transcriptional regulator YafY